MLKMKGDEKVDRGIETGRGVPPPPVFNIIPVHDPLTDHPAMRFPEVRAAIAALQTVGDLRKPYNVHWESGMDLLDWLGFLFGFQAANVRNQREHLVLLLSNAQMRIQPPPDPIDRLVPEVVKKIRKSTTKNYVMWCKFLHMKHNLRLLEGRRAIVDERRELLYICLYLLIWGEAANLRFMPECLCFLYHNMVGELNQVLENALDDTGQLVQPASKDGFLYTVVTPLYNIVRAEAEASRGGMAPHSAWRNYDDMNEYFWSKRCFKQLRWPLELNCNYLVPPAKGKERITKQKVGKTGFVEQRSFWNIYRSFDRVWIGLILVFQLLIILAWNGGNAPWTELKHRDSQARALSIFMTWAGLRALQAFLDAGMEYGLVFKGTFLIGLRMFLKFAVAVAWLIVFIIYYIRMWSQRNVDGEWTSGANSRLYTFLIIGAVFITPEVLALVLFILPWLRNFVETTDWRIFSFATWWFQSRVYVGRGLREGIIDNIKYSLFWIVVLCTKILFSYYLQIKPLITPTKETLDLPSGAITYKWHEFFSKGSRFAVICMWAPVVLIYFMDLQIWYSFYSAIVGALVGLLAHLGEIRNSEQLKLRFQFFPSAVQFVLIPEVEVLQQKFLGTWSGLVKDVIKRFKLRYGVASVGFQQLEAKQIEVGRFKLVWNDILNIFREEDIISDRELDLLQIPTSAWNVSVTQWPSVLLANEILLLLLDCTKIGHHSDKHIWRKISKSEYRRCAVVECYESTKHFLKRVIKDNTIEYQIFLTIFAEIDGCIRQGTFTKTFKLKAIPEVHARLLTVVNIFLTKPTSNDMKKVVDAVQNLHETITRDFPQNRRTFQLLREGEHPHSPRADDLLFVDAMDLPDPEDESFFRQLKRLQTTLSTKEALLNVPKGLEARRRIQFFANSLFMTMPRAPQVEKMLSFSVLTPYYSEDVLYNKAQLSVENEDGVSTLFYLQKIFPDDWDYFEERMAKRGITSIDEMWKEDGGLELRLWASYRGQTLGRTVRGMMYYQRALQKLSFLDVASELDLEGYKELLVRTSSGGDALNGTALQEISSLSHSDSDSSEKRGVELDNAAAAMKFTYVVTCQIYGQQKAAGDRRAKDILFLMETFDALRVAYVDEVVTGRDSKEYYSVLVKFDKSLGKEVEIYRIQLPGPVKLGEGKPENQNHALIFTRGEAVQTIDMNQENYFEEALKMRNLLQEFKRRHGMRKPTILGVREHCFTGSVSSLAWFMSAQETSFVTLGQRVLAKPLKVRMHYGHPDVFDRLWFLTRGGISKASRVINISEDIFAGFNSTLRGGNVTHHEYIQVGKGRDVGLNQIAMFEAKVASGNGEQMLSRDVYRLGHRLDFFRMLSVYYTTVGFYISNMLVVLTVYVFLWGRVYLALSGVEESITNNTGSLSNSALSAALNQQFLVQMGVMTALPMIVENTLELGFLRAVWEFLTMQLQLASVFFTFSMGTKIHYFGRTLLHGGAKYLATGRGFVVKHEKFAEIYRLFSRSHFVKGLEIIMLLIVYEAYGSSSSSTVYILTTISCWFLALTWIMAPFIFNPSGFDWLKSVEDYDDFMNWIWYKGGVFVKPQQSWLSWWNEEQEHLRATGFWGKCLEIVLDLRFFFFQYGIVYQLGIAKGDTSILVYLVSWVYVLVAGVVHMIIAFAQNRYAAKEHIKYRAIQTLVILTIILGLVLLFVFTKLSVVDLIVSILAFVPTGWGILLICLVLRRPFLENTPVWSMVVAVGRLYELGMGLVVMSPVILLSWLPGFQAMQTRILFNEAFSRGLQISRILSGMKSSSSAGHCWS